MKVLVIGSYSRYGPSVIQHLLEKGIDVIGFDRLRMPQDYPGYEGEDKPKVARFLGDVRDIAAVGEAVSIVDGVIHLGGVDDVGFDVGDLVPYETNIVGAINVFQACRFKVRRCVYLVPNSMFAADELAFRFNVAYDTEIAVIQLRESNAEFARREEDVTQGIVAALLDEHFQYHNPFVFDVYVPSLEEVTA